MQPQPGAPYPQNPYAPSAGGQWAPAPAAIPADLIPSIASAGQTALVFLGIRAALPLVFRFVPLGRAFGDPQTYLLVTDGLRGLLGLIALICYFVWFARVYTWVRATRGGARFSNAMAIGGWFIPFAQFAIPYMALRDAWRRGAGDENGYLVAIWWVCYLIALFLQLFFSAGPSMLVSLGPAANTVLPILSWSYTLTQIAAWGLLAWFVQQLTARATAR